MRKILASLGALLLFFGAKAQTDTLIKKETTKPVKLKPAAAAQNKTDGHIKYAGKTTKAVPGQDPKQVKLAPVPVKLAPAAMKEAPAKAPIKK